MLRRFREVGFVLFESFGTEKVEDSFERKWESA